MAAKKSGLGRGYDSLFLDNSTDVLPEGGAVMLNISDIEPDRGQPRINFDEEALTELENSIRAYGVLQPLLVRPVSDGSYRIVAGERRYRAARRAGLSEVPVIIKTLTDEEAAAIALIENLQREDLNAIEEAQGIRRLMEEFGFTQEQTAEKLSKSRPAIANSLRLLSLPDPVKELVASGMLSAGHARALLGLNDPDKMPGAANKILDEHLSVRQTEQLVKTLNIPKKEKLPKIGDTYYNEVQLSLSGVLSRKVKVTSAGKGGKLTIEFFDKEDLAKLIKVFDDE
ncbi:MAG: ParB/RepB/Spo0J family partition protein [Clostridia bacterium]|nr:ParB/RepB/Spo0J family partition protein [Clostridia bacterium]MBR0537421.1 ParB/RepB/Spo0J family partition protein [Clostridia bacterium]